jgi:capsular polysaccharide transport system permease protein
MIGKGLLIELRVVHALILRETRTRFGTHHLGYLWALIEPLIWIVSFLGYFALVQRRLPAGMTGLGFLATGLVPFLLFREASGRASLAVSGNRGLLFYPQIRPFDLVLARVLLEGTTYLCIFMLLGGAEALIRGRLELASALQLLFGLSLAAALGGALGLCLCALTVLAPVVERIQGPVLRPLFWISGIFFCANELPTPLRRFMLRNPLVHVSEIVRAGWFKSYNARYANPWYPLAWILLLGFFGLTLERVARRKLELST